MEKKEIAQIVAVVFIIAFSLSLRNFDFFLYALISMALIVAANIFAKTIVSRYYESEVEVKIWELERYGLFGVFSGGFFHPSKEFKKPIPIGAFIPLMTSVVSIGYFTWLASFVFDVKPKVYRAAKRHGLYSFSEMTEEHLGNIAAAGVIANLALAVIGYLIGFEEFAKLNIYYAAFSMIPMLDLDGNKIFFGNIVSWSFLAAVVMIAVGFVMFMV